MKDRKRGVSDSAIEAVGGLIVGSGVGALVGPEASAAGAAVGSVSAMILAKYGRDLLKYTIPGRKFENGKVLEVLKEKIEAELGSSFLESQRSFELAMQYMQVVLAEASVHEPNLGSLESRLPQHFRWKLPSTQSMEQSHTHNLLALGEFCRANGPIRIGCPAICCAPIAIFRDLSERLRKTFGIEFELVCDEPNGRSFFESLPKDCNLHFAMGPLEALMLADPSRRLPLRVIGPIFGQRQRVFVNTKDRIRRKPGVWIFDRSSAKFQYLVGQGMERNMETQIFHDAASVPDLVEGMPAGDLIIAWDPLSSVLAERKDFKVVHHSGYSVSFCLYGHSKVFRKTRFPLDSFLSVFLLEWRQRKLYHRPLVQMLGQDKDYLKAFALGCGMLKQKKGVE